MSPGDVGAAVAVVAAVVSVAGAVRARYWADRATGARVIAQAHAERAARSAARAQGWVSESVTGSHEPPAPPAGSILDPLAPGEPPIAVREFWPPVMSDPIIDDMYRAHDLWVPQLPRTALEFLECLRQIGYSVSKVEDLHLEGTHRHPSVESLELGRGQTPDAAPPGAEPLLGRDVA